VAFTYLSPMVGIFSLFVLGLGAGGPAYIWLTWIPVAGMLLVALVFGELASHYPVAGALYQYSKYTVGRRFGWFVGWFYGIALLVTVAVGGHRRGALRHLPGQPLARLATRPD
jgi:Amino acid transporters